MKTPKLVGLILNETPSSKRPLERPKFERFEDPWDQAKHEREHLDLGGGLSKADIPKPKASDYGVIADQSRFDWGQKPTAITLFRHYKHSPHHPVSLGFKYLIHRIENRSKYQKASPEKQLQMDKDFLTFHQMGKASEKNGSVKPEDLQEFLVKNPDLIKELIDHKKKLHDFIKKQSPWAIKKIGGEDHIALTRGLDVEEPTRDHALASYADLKDSGFGLFQHHRWVPLKNVWYSYDFGPSKSSSDKFGNENEFLVSPHKVKKADPDDIDMLVPREFHGQEAKADHHLAPFFKKDSKRKERHKVTPDMIDEVLKSDPSWTHYASVSNVVPEAIRHPLATTAHIDKALDFKNPYVRAAAVQNPNANVGHIEKGLGDEFDFVRAAAIRNPNATAAQVEKALNDSYLDVRAAAIKHPNATVAHLDKALDDPDYSIRAAAIENPNATSAHIDKALNDSDYGVRAAAIRYPGIIMGGPPRAQILMGGGGANATAAHIDKALGDSDSYVRATAIQHPNATAAHIDKALNDSSSDVRATAIKHPNATSAHIDKALDDKNLGVRMAAINHPKVTPAHIDKALGDSNPDVRTAASFLKKLKKSEEDLDKGWKETAVGVAMAGSAALASPVPTSQDHLSRMIHQAVMLPEDLKHIAMIESSGGKNKQHAVTNVGLNAGHTAGGATGLMPITIREAVGKNPTLKKKYGHLIDLPHDQITHEINAHPEMENEIAISHWNRLNKVFGGNKAKMAYAWRNGITAAKAATDAEIEAHPYVQKFNGLRTKLAFKKSLLEGLQSLLKKSETDLNKSVFFLDPSLRAASFALDKNPSEGRILEGLKDPDFNVRAAAIKHPNATAAHIDKALSDSIGYVREAAIEHPHATAAHIDKALSDSNDSVRITAIRNPNATAAHIDKALGDSNSNVREAAIEHPNATAAHIDKALSDSRGYVRAAAIKHPNATAAHIDKALSDSNEYVREAAIRRQNWMPF